MSEASVAAALERYAEAKNRRDVDAILAACADDCWYESSGIPGRFEGKRALRAFYEALFAALPDYFGEFDGRAIEGDTAVVWGRFGGTMLGEYVGLPPTGRRIEVPVVFVCTFRDGLLTSDTGYFDAATFWRQAGIEPPAVAAAESPPAPAWSLRDGPAEELLDPADDPRHRTTLAQLVRARAWVRRFDRAWAATDVEALVEPIHPEASILYTMMDREQDREGLRGYFERAFALMPEMLLQSVYWGADGDDVWIQWRATVEIAGAEVEWRGMDRFHFEGDQIVEARASYDPRPFLDAFAAAANRDRVTAGEGR